MTHDFPTLQEVIVLHDVLINTFGGAPGIRDEGALASALMRPQLGYYESLIDQAAALMESLANNHPFLDGNKRVAFFVTDTFLRLNHHFIDCDDDEAYAFIVGNLEAGSFRFAELKTWLQDKVAALPGVR
ncbi:MAG: type II toxin-antitoxin system death-on-curing family toxin [Gemmatimonadota bacterium]|nr:type II toxin-antitoxin system death-on-curing family toxin [Gemmatimonadota bacterium]